MTAGIASNRQKRISEPGMNQGALLKEFKKDIDNIKDSQGNPYGGLHQLGRLNWQHLTTYPVTFSNIKSAKKLNE